MSMAAGLVCAFVGVASADDAARGVDVSEWQGNVDWKAVAQSGVSFGLTRVSDGLGHQDPTFAQNWAGMQQAGIARGAYQYFEPSEDPVAQADLLVNTMGKLGPNDFPPVLDFETTNGLGPAQLQSAIDAWVNEVKKKTGVTPLIYCSPGFWNGLGLSVPPGAELWEADWGPTPEGANGWNGYRFWQQSDSGNVPGISGAVDTDVFNGDPAALKAWIASRQPGPPPPPPAESLVVRVGPNEGLPSVPGETAIVGTDALAQLVRSIADPARKDGKKGKIAKITIDLSGLDAADAQRQFVNQLATLFGKSSVESEIGQELANAANMKEGIEAQGELAGTTGTLAAMLRARGLTPADVFTPDATIVVTGLLQGSTRIDASLAALLPKGGRVVDETQQAGEPTQPARVTFGSWSPTPPPQTLELKAPPAQSPGFLSALEKTNNK
jgi:lysozyme